MWRWLPSVLCNRSGFCVSQRRLFFLKLCGLVFCFHIAILFLYGFFGWVNSGKQRFSVSLSDQGAMYVLMPLQKNVQQKDKKTIKTGNDKHKKSQLIDHETYQRKKKASAKISAAPIQSKQTKTSASIVLKTASKKILNSSKKQSSVALASSSSNKSASKSNQIQTMIVQVQDLKEGVLEKDKNVEKNKVSDVVSDVHQQSVIQDLKESIDFAVEHEESSVKDVPSESFDVDDLVHDEDVIFIGYEQLDQSLISSKIQYTVQQNWTPPVGMMKDISCEIRLKIDEKGRAAQAKVINGSGVFVYDASARKTLLNIEYPKEVWNRTITIVLGA